MDLAGEKEAVALELPIIVSVSGGKDSTALALRLANSPPPAGLRFVFADTAWEAQQTYDYIGALDARLKELCGVGIDRVGVPGGMLSRMRHRAGAPSRMQRWCTRELKIQPLRLYHDAIGDDTVNAVGIRASESSSRSRMQTLEDCEKWGGWVWRPLLGWGVDDVLNEHHAHAMPVNPLYRAGHSRVGCFPCIYASKGEIALLPEERIAELRAVEAELTDLRRARNVERPGRYAHDAVTFFQTRSGASSIDDVVAWSRTSRGGKQLPMFQEPPDGGCFRWGFCDAPGEASETR